MLLATQAIQIQKVRQYYRDTHWYYKYTWIDRQSLAMHFGLYGDGVQSHREALKAMNAQMAELAAIDQNDHVVDAGCGFGGSSIWLARNIGCHVIGLNIVDHQIKAARRYAIRNGVADMARFEVRDFANTGLADGKVSVAWALESLVHSNDQPAALNEFARVLQPGGRIVIGQYFIRDAPSLSEREMDMIETWQDGWAMPRLYRQSDFLGLLAQAGFKIVVVKDLSADVAPSFSRMERLLGIERPWGRFVRGLGLHNAGRHRHNLASQAAADALKAGLWTYGIVVALKV